MRLLSNRTASTLLLFTVLATTTLPCQSLVAKGTHHESSLQNDRKLVRYPDKSNTTKQFPNSVNIRLHWEYNYYWQETHIQKWWCMEMCKPNEDNPEKEVKCLAGRELYIRPCDEHSIEQQFVSGVNGTLQLVAHPGICVTRVRLKVRLLSCEVGNTDQMWQGFDPTGRVFAFSHAALGSGFVMSQHHHPKDRETLLMRPLKLSTAAHTVYWEAWPKLTVAPPKVNSPIPVVDVVLDWNVNDVQLISSGSQQGERSLLFLLFLPTICFFLSTALRF